MIMQKLFCATVLYRFVEDEKFDVGRYAESIAPRYAELLGDNCVKFEVRKGMQPGGGPKLEFICIASFWIKSPGEFLTSMQHPGMKALMDEIARFTTIEPIRQFDEVILFQTI